MTTDITGLVADAREVFSLGSHGEAFDMLAAALTAQSQALTERKKLAEGLMGYAVHDDDCNALGAPIVPGPCSCGLSALTKKMEEMGE